MMNLYEVSNKYLTVLNSFHEHEEECDQHDISLLKEIDAIEDAIEDKAINIAAYIKNLESEYEQVYKARSSMQNRERRLKGKIDWLEDYLKLNLERVGILEVNRSPNFVIKIRDCPYSVNIIDESKIPDEYKSVKSIVNIDKNKLKDDLKHGLSIEGANLQRKTTLLIK